MVDNPWPDFTKERRRTVKTILAEIGSGIEERTEGAIEFRVDTRLNLDGSIVHKCILYVRSIDYGYPFLDVVHHLNQYPAVIFPDTGPIGITSNNDEEFINNLINVIKSDATVNVVTQLLEAAA